MSKDGIQYVQLDAAAFLSDSDYQIMSAEQRGVYCSVIFYLYANGGKLLLNSPDKQLLLQEINSEIALLSNCTKVGVEWEKIWHAIRKKFKIKNGVLSHKRVTEELKKAANYRKQKSLAGKKGMQHRYNSVRGGVITNINKGDISKDIHTHKGETGKKTFTLGQCKDAGYIAGITEAEAEIFFHHFNAQGWVRGNGQQIDDLVSAITYWRNNKHKFEDKKNDGSSEKGTRPNSKIKTLVGNSQSGGSDFR